MKYKFPVYVVHTDNVELIDGILWIEDQVLDDKNMSGETLGRRRLQTPMKSLYPLRYMITDTVELIKHKGNFYIDSTGHFFRYYKENSMPLKYHKIRKVEKKRGRSIVWLKGINNAYDFARPPSPQETWAGVLYRSGIPWLIYEVCKERKKDTWRKV